MDLGQLSESKSPLPKLIDGSPHLLSLNACLMTLPTYEFEVDRQCRIAEIFDRFEQFPGLPGVVTRQPNQVPSMLSRPRFLEQWLLLSEPARQSLTLAQLLRQGSIPPPLCLSANLSILSAAKQALRRPIEFHADPIVLELETGDHLRLISAFDLNAAHWQIRGIETQVRYERLQVQMLQSDKMADLGRLVDGVAHEILDPVSFIWGNLSHIKTYAHQLLALLEAYEKHCPEPPISLKQLREEVEIEYIRDDFLQAIKSVRGGADRLRQLAVSLQNFCHIDEVYPRPSNLHSLLDSILLLLQSRLETHIEIVKHYGKLPPVPCFAGQMGQVLMNILVNIIDVLLEQIGQLPQADQVGARPQITITTEVCSPHTLTAEGSEPTRWVSLVIRDNGPGLPPEAEAELMQTLSAHHRIFKETSLAMSYRIVTAKHGGEFWVRSQRFTQPQNQTYQGTEFQILLPLLITDR